MSYALHTNGSKFKKGGKPSQSGVAVGGVLLSYMGYFQVISNFSDIGGWGNTRVLWWRKYLKQFFSNPQLFRLLWECTFGQCI